MSAPRTNKPHSGGAGGGGGGFSRRGDRERLLFIASAGLAFSLLVITLVVLSYRSAISTQVETPAPVVNEPALGTISVLTLDKQIPAGTKLTGLEVRESFWRRDRVPTGAIFERSELKDKFAKEDLVAGAIVTREQLTDNPIQTSLPLTPGFRAVSIDCDAVACLEGHALPGTRVDVLMTSYEDQNLVTTVVVQNARVLSYAGRSERVAGDRNSRAEVGRTITLEVSPTDALKVRTASQIGKLSLIMRSRGDEKGVAVDRVDRADLGAPDQKPVKRDKCLKQGKISIGGQEYVMDCDGQIQKVSPGLD